MGRTPDRYPGIREEEAILLTDSPSPPTDPYTLARVGGEVQAVDSEGTFNPREATKLTGFPIFGTPTAYQVLIYNATLERWEPATISGGVMIFGTEYQHDELLPLFETTSETYVQRFRWTTTDLPAGSYFVAIQATLDTGDDAGVGAAGRIQLDDTTTIAEAAIKPGVEYGGGAIVSFVGNLVLDGVHFFDVDVKRVGGRPIDSAGIRDIHAVLWRAL